MPIQPGRAVQFRPGGPGFKYGLKYHRVIRVGTGIGTGKAVVHDSIPMPATTRTRPEQVNFNGIILDSRRPGHVDYWVIFNIFSTVYELLSNF